MSNRVPIENPPADAETGFVVSDNFLFNSPCRCTEAQQET